MRTRLRGAGALLVLCAPSSFSQTLIERMPAWSPIAPRADLPRFLPSVTGEPGVLGALRFKPGIFMLSGNPAVLDWELLGAQSDYRASRLAESGTFRRPFDAPRVTSQQISASGWTQLSNGSVFGEVSEEERRFSPGPRVDQFEPYGSSPLALVDTTSSPMRSSGVRLHGGGGWRMGEWGAGISAAYDTRDVHTDQAGFVRQSQISRPGVIAGVAGPLGATTPIIIGIDAGLRRTAETTNLIELAAEGRLYQFTGYRDTPPIDVVKSYYQRFDEHTGFGGAQAIGELFGTRWLLGIERSRRSDGTTHAEVSNALADRWVAHGTSYQLMLDRSFSGGTRATFFARSDQLHGAATMALDSVSFDARERVTAARLEIRAPLEDNLHVIAAFSVEDARRIRADSATSIETNLWSRQPGLAVDLEYALSSSGLITIGVSRGWYRSQGHIPTASRPGAAYARYIAPEVALYASPMNPTGATIAIHWRLTAATYLNVSGEQASLAAVGFRVFPELPDGDRTATRLTFGLSILGGALSSSSRAR